MKSLAAVFAAAMGSPPIEPEVSITTTTSIGSVSLTTSVERVSLFSVSANALAGS